MVTKADRERKKQEKEERAEREAAEAVRQAAYDARADELTPFVGKLVSYYSDGWRVGTLNYITGNKRKTSVAPMKTRWMSAAPRNVVVPILDVKPIEVEAI